MTLPDKAAEGVQQEFSWDESDPAIRGRENSIHAQFIQGTTIVFDSFSSEQDVKRRNEAAINISKISDSSLRFDTDFTVRASGEVTAVLSASTVASYRVVDLKKGQHQQTPIPPPAIPSFSSIISNGVAPIAQSDRDLAASLAACASPSIAPGSNSNARTEQLRKRCRTMLQQRSAHHPSGVAPASCMVKNKSSYSVGLKTDLPAPSGVSFSNAADKRNFFAPVLRPVAVQQALHKYDDSGRTGADGNTGIGGGGGAVSDAGEYAADQSTEHTPLSDGMGDGSRLGLSSAMPSASGATTPPPSFLSRLCAAAPGAALMQQSAFSLFVSQTLPPLVFPVPGDSHRMSSSDLVFACPVPVGGLMNLSDIRFHRSSDEIVTLSAIW
jgi:hypothetical protein